MANKTITRKAILRNGLQLSSLSTVILHLTFSWPAGHICPTYKEFLKSAGITVSHFFSMLPSTSKYLYSVEPVRMHFPVYKWYCVQCCMQHCTQYHLYTGKSILTGSTEYRYYEVAGSMENKWDTVIPVDSKRLFISGTYMSRWSRKVYPLKAWIKSHPLFAGIIRSSPFPPR